jgi:hypothetical protein
VQPRGERRVATELVESLVRPQKRFLREVLRQVLFSSHSVGTAVYPVHVRIVERAKGSFITFAGPLDQF